MSDYHQKILELLRPAQVQKFHVDEIIQNYGIYISFSLVTDVGAFIAKEILLVHESDAKGLISVFRPNFGELLKKTLTTDLENAIANNDDELNISHYPSSEIEPLKLTLVLTNFLREICRVDVCGLLEGQLQNLFDQCYCKIVRYAESDDTTRREDLMDGISESLAGRS